MGKFKNIRAIVASLSLLATAFTMAATAHPYWITDAESQSATNTWLCFKKTVNINADTAHVIGRIAADSKYWLWINGELAIFEGGVKRGPTPTDTYCDSVDLSTFFRKGDNTIAVLVWYYGKEGFSYNPSGKAGLFFDCMINDTLPLCSDASWQTSLHPAYYTPTGQTPNYRLPESNIGYDARKDIGEWWKPGYVRKWKKASICGKEGCTPWGKLFDRIIPQWHDSGLKDYEALEIRHGADTDTIIGILPYNCQITPYFTIDSDTVGAPISIYTDHYLGGSAPNVRAEYLTRRGVQSYENLGWMNGQEIYYIYPHGIKVNTVKYRETAYATDFAGSMQCDDEFFNRYFDKAKRTLLVTMRDTYMDCPDRERAQWWGDLVTESAEAFYALDPRSHLLMKKGMYELIGWQTEEGVIYSPIPSSNYDAELPGQMLASIGHFGFWNYYLHTADLETIRQLYPGVRRYLQTWTLNDGLLVMRPVSWFWGDWGSNIDKKGIVNIWYYLALKGAKNMADALGLSDDAIEYQSTMSTMEKAINEKFWTGKCYKHPEFNSESVDERVSALAVVAGIVDEAKYPSIIDVFCNYEYASPYMEKYVTEACFLMGVGKFGLQRMKKRFSPMVNDQRHSTLFEGWDIGNKGYGGGSTNHAWSGGGLTVFAEYVIGVSPNKPGYESILVSPNPSGLKHAEMEMSTVKGEMAFSFDDNADSFALNISVPENIETVVNLNDDYKQISLNGEIIPIDHSRLVLLKGGNHSLICLK